MVSSVSPDSWEEKAFSDRRLPAKKKLKLTMADGNNATMRLAFSAALVLFSATVSAQDSSTCASDTFAAPLITPRTLQNGIVVLHDDLADTTMALDDVFGCCAMETCAATDTEQADSMLVPQRIGRMPQMTQEQTLQVLGDAKRAWKGGMGEWPQMSLQQRVLALQRFFEELKPQREAIVQVLMWEIGKNRRDAESEFDRTMQFAQQVMEAVQTEEEFLGASWQSVGATRAFVRRAAIGIILALSPKNYPLNESYAAIIPALLMGNVVVMKIPTVGGLAHLLTLEAFSKTLPPGAVNFISGRGRATMPPLMVTGQIDGLAFIGGSNAADDLIKKHPHPHRLKVFLQLEANNMGIFLSDVFEPQNAALLETSLGEAILGSLSFNGQRCTALKLFFVPSTHASMFATKMAERVDALKIGLPWKTWDDGSYSDITPLPDQKSVDYMKRLIEDAVSKGANVINQDGGTFIGGPDSSLMVPAVLYPVTSDMDVYHEEQFGPVVPIAPYDDLHEILAFGRDGEYAQQVSIFTSQEQAGTAAEILDKFSSVFGKININAQCGRSPDTLPFSGRRSSAMGVMSVKDILREFSVPTVVSYKERGTNSDIVKEIQQSSVFLETPEA